MVSKVAQQRLRSIVPDGYGARVATFSYISLAPGALSDMGVGAA